MSMKIIRSYLAGLLVLMGGVCQAQDPIEMTTSQAKSYYKNTSKRWVSCHDPSVVWNPTTQKYYIFGSHLAQASTADMQNWATFRAPWGAVQSDGSIRSGVSNTQAFRTHQVKTVKIGGKDVAFGNYDVYEWAAAYGDYSIDGNLWAPDVIYNEAMKKWCMYMSVNGPNHNCAIVLLTSDKIDGTYVYQGPVIYTGFKNANDARVSWKKTDLELVLGELSALPARYHWPNGLSWGDYWPNGIDPCVFYDEEGKLWMSYGSWSGGIWVLELDEKTGLRDYDVKYGGDYDTKKRALTCDPYYGKRIAGGCYVSGEASYIEHIGDHYYLFMTYGGLESTGGYQMRVFRSKNPDGPYVDGMNRSAIFTNYALNYGVNTDQRGQLILGAYDDWGFMSAGEVAQGHNSVIAAPDGRSYLVYHTRFNTGGEGHQVRVHQLYLNKDGWLVASPFEYNGGKTTDEDISTKTIVPTDKVPGTYNLLVHRYSLDHKNLEVVTPVEVKFLPDGTISGAYSGKWSVSEGNSYLSVTLGATTYQGVLVEEQMDGKNIQTISFTACAKNGVHIWGYKMREDYLLAWQVNNQTIPVREGQSVSENIDLYGALVTDGVDIEWTSSRPDVISRYGRYNPTGLTESVPVDLNVKLTSGNYYWQNSYSVTAEAEMTLNADWYSGIVAHYDFDSTVVANRVNEEERAMLLKTGSNVRPTLESDSVRNGMFAHLSFGGNGQESYVRMANPFYNQEIEDGITISFLVKRSDNNLWDALFSFYNPSKKSRLYMTGGAYIGYNNNAGNWVDINHPNSFTDVYIPAGPWHVLTLTIGRKASSGIKLYIDGVRKSKYVFNGSFNGKNVSTAGAVNYSEIVDHIISCTNFNLGYGSFWGTPDVCIDELIIHNRVLSISEIMVLGKMMNRVNNLAETTDIEGVMTDCLRPADDVIYDLGGRRVENPRPGIYIRGGRKFIVK